MQPWLKAGLIGGGVLAAVNLLTSVGSLVAPALAVALSCCLCLPLLLIYPLTGVLAAYWLPQPLTLGQGARGGTLAGLVAVAVSTVFGWLVGLVLALAGVSQRALSQLDPQSLAMLRDSGLDVLYTPGGMVALAFCGGIVGLVWGAGFGALGGVIYAAIKRR